MGRHLRRFKQGDEMKIKLVRFDMNDVFERGLKWQHQKAQRTTISRSLVFIRLMKSFINTMASGGAKLKKLIWKIVLRCDNENGD